MGEGVGEKVGEGGEGVGSGPATPNIPRGVGVGYGVTAAFVKTQRAARVTTKRSMVKRKVNEAAFASKSFRCNSFRKGGRSKHSKIYLLLL